MGGRPRGVRDSFFSLRQQRKRWKAERATSIVDKIFCVERTYAVPVDDTQWKETPCKHWFEAEERPLPMTFIRHEIGLLENLQRYIVGMEQCSQCIVSRGALKLAKQCHTCQHILNQVVEPLSQGRIAALRVLEN